VPQLPPILPLPFEHSNTEYQLVPQFQAICGTIVCMHHLTTYLWLMDQFANAHEYELDSGRLGTPAAAVALHAASAVSAQASTSFLLEF
jgi:hypothetical protein